MRHLHLFIQPPHDLGREVLGALPGLGKLLRRGRRLPAPACISEACCLALGIPKQQDWPIAPFTARAAGLDVGKRHCLRLDPVHLDVGMHGMFLRAGLSLDEGEAAHLQQIASPILAKAALEAFAGPGGVLYVSSETPPRLATTPLDQVDGRQPTRFLPTGEDAPFWIHLLHEVQMSLHEHPFNQTRMAAGKPPVNSLWPWGGGRFVPPARTMEAIWGNLPLLRQLAAALDIPAHPCPAALDQVQGVRASHGLVLLGGGACAENTHEPPLEAWEKAWFQPLAAALRRGRLVSATLSIFGQETESCALTPLDIWRLWV